MQNAQNKAEILWLQQGDQTGKTWRKIAVFVQKLSVPCDQRRVHQRDKDRTDTNPLKAVDQQERQQHRKPEHSKIVDTFCLIHGQLTDPCKLRNHQLIDL